MCECPTTGIVILRPQVKLKSYKPLLFLCFCTRIHQHIPSLFSFQTLQCTNMRTHTLFLFISALTSFTQLVSWGSLEYPGLGGFGWLPLSAAANQSHVTDPAVN